MLVPTEVSLRTAVVDKVGDVKLMVRVDRGLSFVLFSNFKCARMGRSYPLSTMAIVDYTWAFFGKQSWR